MRPAPAWCMRYVGKPHEMGARGPDAYDCWGLVVDVLDREFGCAVPPLEGADLWAEHERLALGRAATDGAFVEVLEPQVGDVLVFALTEQHVGLVVGRDWMLHTTTAQGVHLSRWRVPPWSRIQIAAYRPREVVRG